jgi:predicted TPR repeat methyltransferase
LNETPEFDYRQSHLFKGNRYDAALASDPFDIYMHRQESAFLRGLIPYLFPRGIGRYLDFACGTGRISEVVSPFASEAIGVDVSDSMLAKARERCPAMSFLKADLTNHRNRPALGQFDLVTAFRFFGNAQDELRTSALETIRDLLKDDGYFVLNNHRNPSSLLSLLDRFRRDGEPMDLSHFKLRGLLAASGLRIVSSRACGAWVIRHKFAQPRVLTSRVARVLETVCSSSIFVPVCLDAMIVVRKRRGRAAR